VGSAATDHYATLGLDRRCGEAEIRKAYRLLAKQLHPDVNGGSAHSVAQTQRLNEAHETLSDPTRRERYDRELRELTKPVVRPGRAPIKLAKDVHLRLEEFLRGTRLEVRVDDPGNEVGPETYELVVPAGTAPGTRIKLARDGGGTLVVRVMARPDFRFKARGSDLRCDLKISFQRAQQGGTETVRNVLGSFLRIQIPPNVARGETIRIAGEGLPKSRGGRGDLLVRILHQPKIQFHRTHRR